MIKRKRTNRATFAENLMGWLCASPLIIGTIVFAILPMILSLIYSFHKYNLISSMEFVGFRNYINVFTKDRDILQNIKVTGIYTAINLVFSVGISFTLALFMNKNMAGIKVIRILVYLPCTIPTIVSGLLWRNMLDYEYGFVNSLINSFGLPSATFFTSSKTALYTLFLCGFFGLGGEMILWLAQLKSIDKQLYESAELDGASKARQLLQITVPLCTPMIFYKLIMCVISSLQAYEGAMVMLGGGTGPDNSCYFLGLRIYNLVFNSAVPNIGYASALSWLLFLVIGVITVLLFKTNKWTYYSEDE